jgi:hypothetical protein
MSPATSKSQRRLMAAAAHGADFPKAQALRESMSQKQLHDFAATPEKGLPMRAPHPAKNLAGHLRKPMDGEICVECHRGRKR